MEKGYFCIVDYPVALLLFLVLLLLLFSSQCMKRGKGRRTGCIITKNAFRGSAFVSSLREWNEFGGKISRITWFEKGGGTESRIHICHMPFVV